MKVPYHRSPTRQERLALCTAAGAFFLAFSLILSNMVLAQKEDKLEKAQQELIQKVTKAKQDQSLITKVKELLGFFLEKPKSVISTAGGTRCGGSGWVLPQGKVLTGAPTFRWRSFHGAGGYLVSVSRNDHLVWKRQTSKTQLPYPADQAPLTEGCYTLTAEPLQKGLPLAATGCFAVPPEAVRRAATARAGNLQEQLQGVLTLSEILLLRATLYAQEGYLTAAFESLEKASDLDPQNPLVRQALLETQKALDVTGNVPEGR